MNPPTINQVCIWRFMKRDELDIKTFENYQFMHKGIIQSASSLKPVIRYAKNYGTGRKKFSLCIISQERNTKKMEAFLDKAAKDVKYDPAGPDFIKTEVFYQ